MEKKKMSIKKKVLIFVLFFVLAVIIILFVHTLKNFLIIRELRDKISRYSDSTNYHVKSINTHEDGLISTINYYQKGEKQLITIERGGTAEFAKISIYNNGERIDMFTETDDEKTANLDSGNGGIFGAPLSNGLEKDLIGENQLLICFLAKMRNVTVNDKDCYNFSHFLSGSFMYTENDEYYYEKETGLLIMNIFGADKIEKEYEFDNVDDSIFIEPNIGEYSIIKNSD